MKPMTDMSRRAATLGVALAGLAAVSTHAADNSPVRGPGVNVRRSGKDFGTTVERLQQDVKAKGIRLFDVIDQAKLGAEAGIALRPSTLLVFGNPPLGIQFLTANPLSGLDWPVRLLVFQDEHDTVWIACTDFTWIARRHGIQNRDTAFAMATKVVASIVASVDASPA
jgi:uncharacterized protein (DUF302 family)